MGDMPLITVIIPVYNVEKYLSKCLDSIINQTYHNLEIICVNDGSTDKSGEILSNYEKFDSRIKVITQSNAGASEARNKALDNVTGKYLIFVDADDYIEPNLCELAVQSAIKNNADLVFWSYVREFSNISKEKHYFWSDGTVFEGEEVETQLHRKVCGLVDEELAHPDYLNSFEPVVNKLYKADYILDNNIRFVDIKKIATSEDGVFNLYALGYVKKAVYIKKCLYHYNKTNDTSITTSYKEKLFSQRNALTQLFYQYLNENDMPKDFYIALENRIALNLIGLGLNIISANFNISKKIRLISEILNDVQYKKAYRNLKLNYFPIHWKLFFFCAKMHLSFILYILLLCMKNMIGR